jgi:hypothetical protein
VADHIEQNAFLLSALKPYQGACLMSVWANVASLAREYSTPRLRGFQVHRAQLPALGGVLEPALETTLLFFIAHGRPEVTKRTATCLPAKLSSVGSGAGQRLPALRRIAQEVVANRKEGNQVFYSLRDPVLAEVLDILKRHFYPDAKGRRKGEGQPG